MSIGGFSADRNGKNSATCGVTRQPSPPRLPTGLKALGWVTPHAKYPRLLFATADANPALIAFEAVIADRLNHPAFSQFGAVEVKTSEARAWSESWALESPTDAEKRVMANMLLGTRAPPSRRNGCALMIAAVNFTGTTDTGAVRAAMAGAPSGFVPSSDLEGTLKAWRRVQVRQLFRLSLEAFSIGFSWKSEEGRDPPRRWSMPSSPKQRYVQRTARLLNG
jgi:hypothetical protein